jgi:cysteine synthase
MTSILDLIGETPLIEVTRFDRGPCRLFLKLESANPSGSIKDRPARAMIEAAEAEGRLQPGGTIVEATAGNTGLGLALVGGRKGYRIVLVVPDKMAREKILHCKAMGAEVVLTRSDVGRGHPDYSRSSRSIARLCPRRRPRVLTTERQTLTMRLPRFSPASSPISAAGVFSRPLITSSSTFSLPSLSHAPRSAKALSRSPK